VAPDIAGGRVIVAHLQRRQLCDEGAQASTARSASPRSTASAGTRPADRSRRHPSTFQTLGQSAADVEKLLYKIGPDWHLRHQQRHARSAPERGSGGAWRLTTYQAAKHVGSLAAALGGVDALVFTAGIGEHSAEIRRRIGEASAWLGVELDARANATHGPRISTAASRVSVWVVPTNEELMIARHTGVLLGISGRRA
jgi:acetate kinase